MERLEYAIYRAAVNCSWLTNKTIESFRTAAQRRLRNLLYLEPVYPEPALALKSISGSKVFNRS